MHCLVESTPVIHNGGIRCFLRLVAQASPSLSAFAQKNLKYLFYIISIKFKLIEKEKTRLAGRGFGYLLDGTLKTRTKNYT